MAGAVEGSLIITLRGWDKGERGVSICSTRPLHMPKIFVGKGVDELIRTLPLLYNVCGTAQACAAAEACEQALGIDADTGRREAREMLVWFETAREHIWRILLDWSAFLTQPSDSATVADAMGLFSDFRNALYPDREPFRIGQRAIEPNRHKLEQVIGRLEQLLERSLYTYSPDEWLGIDSEEALSAWIKGSESIPSQLLRQLSGRGWSGIGSAASTALREVSVETLEDRLGGGEVEAFIATPTHEGHCCETTPYTRVRGQPLVKSLSADYGSGLLPRTVARLVELAGIPARLKRGITHLGGSNSPLFDRTTADNIGIAQVEAARGRLVHRVELVDQRIADYRILAPTEWNFHPEGVLAQGLMSLDGNSHEELKQQATWLINAIDPCVGYSLEIV
ncbi:MAG: nickel-dependent hydrogenase large subunit [Candidatus Sedimenticola sp. (ex Thyasira tokunagai)]